MKNHGLWFLSQWVWKKLRKEKARTKSKEIKKLLSSKKAGNLANAKASQVESGSINCQVNDTPNRKVKGAAKRILTNSQIHIAFTPVPWKVNLHVMVKGAASQFDGNLNYWVNRNSRLYADSPTGSAMKRQKMKCGECNHLFYVGDTVELHHIDGNHENWSRRCIIET